VGDQAAARLLRVEAAAAAQAAQLEAARRQLEKLALRSWLTGRDLKLPIQQVSRGVLAGCWMLPVPCTHAFCCCFLELILLRTVSLLVPLSAPLYAPSQPSPCRHAALVPQLQAAAGQQAEALVGVVQRMERMEKEIKDTGGQMEGRGHRTDFALRCTAVHCTVLRCASSELRYLVAGMPRLHCCTVPSDAPHWCACCPHAAAAGAEGLVEGMQGVSAKQFELLLKILKQQQQAQQQQPPPPPQQRGPAAASSSRPSGAAQAAPRGVTSSSGAGGAGVRSAPVAGQQVDASRASQMSSTSSSGGGSHGSAGSTTDEWGRRVVPVSAPSTPSTSPAAAAAAAAAPATPPLPSAAAAASALSSGASVLRPLGATAPPAASSSSTVQQEQPQQQLQQQEPQQQEPQQQEPSPAVEQQAPPAAQAGDEQERQRRQHMDAWRARMASSFGMAAASKGGEAMVTNSWDDSGDEGEEVGESSSSSRSSSNTVSSNSSGASSGADQQEPAERPAAPPAPSASIAAAAQPAGEQQEQEQSRGVWGEQGVRRATAADGTLTFHFP
jgi:hypothetical protein